MLFRYPLFVWFFITCSVGYGQAIEQDTAYWEAYDAAMVDRIWDGMEEPTYRELFDSLKVALARRLKNGPVTESLAYRYHWISLRLKTRFPVEVKPYADTAIMLRIEAKAPTADIAQSYYEKGRVLRILGNGQESLHLFEEGVRIMSQAIMELDSTPNLAKRQAYFLVEAGLSAGENGNFELGKLRLRQIPSLLQLDTSSLAVKTSFESMIAKGKIEALSGNYALSVQSYREALESNYFDNASLSNRGSVIGSLGMSLLWSGMYAEAEDEMLASLQLFEASESWLNISSTCINIMNLRVLQKRPQEALDLIEIAESSARKVEGAKKGIVYGELSLPSKRAKTS